MTDGSSPRWIYHITTRSQWEDALPKLVYEGDTLGTEGFIHCSTREQVLGTANAFYRGRLDLVLLEIDTQKLAPELRYDQIPDGRFFPHLYGPLNVSAVARVFPFEPSPDGTFSWPEPES